MRKEYFVSDLSRLDPEERFESPFLVQAKEIRHKKSGDPYLSLKLADRTGSVDAKMWDNVPSFVHRFKARDLVHVRGKVQLYNGNLQVIVHRVEAIADSQAQLADFVPHTERDIEAMYAEVLATIEGFENPHLKRLLESIFRNPKFAAAYKRAPAASSMHHARIGGLLEHVSSVVRLAVLVSSHYDDIDHDLLVSGVLLHDLGKIRELTSGPSFEYTDEGRLLGHIAIGSAWVGRRCDEIHGFPPRLKSLLLHMILSHHGKLEFGSPQVPQFPEALALHQIDNLDSKLEAMRTARTTIADGGAWTQFQRGLDCFVLDKEAYLRGDPAWVPPQPSAAPEREGTVEATVEPQRRAPAPPPDLPVAEAVAPDSTPPAAPEPSELAEVQATSAAETAAGPEEHESLHHQPSESAPTPDLPVTGGLEAVSPAEAAAEPEAPAEDEAAAPPETDLGSTPEPSEPGEAVEAVSGSDGEPEAAGSPADEPARTDVSESNGTVESEEPQAEAAPTAQREDAPLRPAPIESPKFVVNKPERVQPIDPPELPVSDQSSLFAASDPGPETPRE